MDGELHIIHMVTTIGDIMIIIIQDIMIMAIMDTIIILPIIPQGVTVVQILTDITIAACLTDLPMDIVIQSQVGVRVGNLI